MALAQTSLDIDLLTMATLYNRGVYFSTGLSYVPVVSSFGTFNKWTIQNNENIFISVFYTYSNGDIFLTTVSSIQSRYDLLSSSVYINTDTFSEFLSTNNTQLNTINNIGFSTLSSYNYSLILNSTIVSTTYSSVSHYFSSITPGVTRILDRFYDTLFSPIASTIIRAAINKYVPLGNISDFTYDSKTNPNPYFGGIFGNTTPLPAYWLGPRTQFIGPGLSSISTLLDFTYNTSITSVFPDALNNISTAIYDSNVSLDKTRGILENAVNNAPYYLESGSSISTQFSFEANTQIQSTLNSASTFGSYVSTISTIFINRITNESIPTLDGYSLSQYISTANTQFIINQNASNTSLYSTMSSLETLIAPYTVFSTIAHSTLSSYLNSVGSLSFVPGIQEMSTTMFSVITPFVNDIDVSTNYNGYLGLSSYKETIFSSYSTTLPFTIGYEVLSSLRNINSKISTLSTSLVRDYNTNINTINSYITEPGLSEITSSFSTNLSVVFNNYAEQISSIIYEISTQMNIVNPIRGLSSLNSTALVYNSTNMGILSSLSDYINSGYRNEYQQILTTSTSVLTDININVDRYISAGISSFKYSASTFTVISTIQLQEVNKGLEYIQLQTMPITGKIYSYMNDTIMTESIILEYLRPFSNSTIYYQPLDIIENYSTSLFKKGENVPSYISRSTTFLSIYTDRIFHSMSSLELSTSLSVQMNNNSDFSLNLYGSMSVQPFTIQNFGVPNLKLPNFDIFTNTGPVYIPQNSVASLSSYDSTIALYYHGLSIKRQYRSYPYSYTGINTIYPGYSLDIFIGDARKPTGVTWITASDKRVKDNISTPDTICILRQISSLRLVSYNWVDGYRSAHGLTDKKEIGFITQEVKSIFPTSVTESEENGYSDFHSLDVDQIYKAKVAVTQYLINKITNLQLRISTLMKS